MKTPFIICLFFVSIVFYACGPHATEVGIPSKITLTGYGAAIDSSYYKVWNDSSWESFYQDTTINGKTYATILDAYGTEYFYDSSAYAGLQLSGYNAFIFDSSLAPPPDTMIVGKTYTMQTTFTYQGVAYVLTDQETAQGAFLVQVPIGTFNNCPTIVSNQTITASGQQPMPSDVEYWLAKGPSDIQQNLIDLSYTKQMSYGFVNGQFWGSHSSQENIDHVPSYSGTLKSRRLSETASSGYILDMHSFAPVILKGIIR